jgi:pyridoxal phosphate enzyme (YggS family)
VGSAPSQKTRNLDRSKAEAEGLPLDGVADRLARVRERILDAETRFGRPAGDVRLLAVSKKHGPDKIRSAFAAGQTAFGESYLSEALEKIEALSDLATEWHFIGRIQSNKTRKIAEQFAWVHGLADLRHAQRLSQQRPPQLPPLKACIQVNISGEGTKAGVSPEEAAELLVGSRDLPNIEIVGLMALPAPAADEEAQRLPFRALRRLRDRLASADCPLPELSMGMSADLEAAIAEGATIVRVGTAVFGPRV